MNLLFKSLSHSLVSVLFSIMQRLKDPTILVVKVFFLLISSLSGGIYIYLAMYYNPYFWFYVVVLLLFNLLFNLKSMYPEYGFRKRELRNVIAWNKRDVHSLLMLSFSSILSISVGFAIGLTELREVDIINYSSFFFSAAHFIGISCSLYLFLYFLIRRKMP